MATTRIPVATVAAFRATHYTVDAEPPFVLCIDEPNAALAALHAARGVACSAFVTACNPHCLDLGVAANAPRTAALLAELRAAGVAFVPGAGRHPSNGWPPEPSVLALGLDRAAARALGVRHGQAAIVWCGPDAVPRLELLE
ncbi:MAG: DUF3293 domain-containing protein [Phycisphaerales bacterium]|nr:DUF3293 domain-containing protein [Phycisphaerales bacterium]